MTHRSQRYPLRAIDQPQLIADWRQLAQNHRGQEAARLRRLADQLEGIGIEWGFHRTRIVKVADGRRKEKAGH